MDCEHIWVETNRGISRGTLSVREKCVRCGKRRRLRPFAVRPTVVVPGPEPIRVYGPSISVKG